MSSIFYINVVLIIKVGDQDCLDSSYKISKPLISALFFAESIRSIKYLLIRNLFRKGFRNTGKGEWVSWGKNISSFLLVFFVYLTHFLRQVAFSTSWKHSFSNVVRGYRTSPLAWYQLMLKLIILKKVKDNVMKKREQFCQNENAKQLCQFSKWNTTLFAAIS